MISVSSIQNLQTGKAEKTLIQLLIRLEQNIWLHEVITGSKGIPLQMVHTKASAI
jgi:hypothetical protein